MSEAACDRRTCMLIIAGHLVVDPEHRDTYVAGCIETVHAALAAPGCLAFAITADTVDPGRVVIYERWEGEDELLAFRGDAPEDDQGDLVRGADVRRYVISSVEDP